LGCDDFLRKPFREGILFELMHKHLGIQFIYEIETPEVATIDNLSIDVLPAALKQPLEAALQRLEVHAIDDAIEAIRHHDAVLAGALAKLAKNFEYRRILDLLK